MCMYVHVHMGIERFLAHHKVKMDDELLVLRYCYRCYPLLLPFPKSSPVFMCSLSGSYYYYTMGSNPDVCNNTFHMWLARVSSDNIIYIYTYTPTYISMYNVCTYGFNRTSTQFTASTHTRPGLLFHNNIL